MKQTYRKAVGQAQKMGVIEPMSMMKRYAERKRRSVTPRRAKHTRGRKPIEE